MVDKEIHYVTLPEEEFVKQSIDIVKRAQDEGIILRILGGLAVYVHTMDQPETMSLYDRLRRFGEGKPQFTDLDLIGYSKQMGKIEKFFERELGFKPDFYVNRILGLKRLLFYHPENYYHVDIFFDKLEFSHDVEFGNKPGKGRLELDFPTIALCDIVLEKTQIHEINLKDVVDLIILFAGHDVAEDGGKDLIDGKYIAQVLCDDWGFWYDAMNNLKIVKEYTKNFFEEGKLKENEYNRITGNVDKLIQIIESTPKTKKWRKRAEKGTSKKWWRDVEEVAR